MEYQSHGLVPLERGPNPVVYHGFSSISPLEHTDYNRHFGVYPSIFPPWDKPTQWAFWRGIGREMNKMRTRVASWECHDAIRPGPSVVAGVAGKGNRSWGEWRSNDHWRILQGMWRIHSLIVWNLFALYVKTRCILNGGRLHPLLLQMAFPTHWMIIPLLLGWASEPPTNHQFLVSLQQFSRKGTARTRLIEKSPPEHRHVYSYSHYIPIISHNNHYDYIFY